MRPLFARRARIAVAVAALGLVVAACSNPQGVGGDGEVSSAEGVPPRVEMVIPYEVGGGTDTWARFLAPYLEKHIEGHPTFTATNVEGGESVTGSNQFVTSGGTDGSQVLVTSGTTYFQALLGRDEVQFDFSRMRPLILNGTGGVIYASKSSGITSVEDLQNPPKPLTYGGISATGLDLSLLQAFDVLDVEVDATFGFEGREPALLALQRGEVNIDYQTTAAYLTDVKPLVDQGKVVPLMSFGYIKGGEVVRDPNVPELPTVGEVYARLNGKEPSGPAYEAYNAFLEPGYVYQKGLWANEGTPDSVVQAYYDAVRPITDDPEFQRSSEDVLGGYPMYSGEAAAQKVRESFQIDPEVREYTVDMLEEQYNTSADGS